MARFVFLPDPTRASSSFELASGKRIRSGQVFEASEADAPVIEAVNSRVPGPVVTGSKDRLQAIRPVEAQPVQSPAVSSQAIEGDLYAQLAERVGLAPTVSPVGLVEEIGIRLSRIEEFEAQVEKKKRKPQAEKPAPETAPVEGEG